MANDDVYSVEANGTLNVQASFPTSIATKDPSLYWNFNGKVGGPSAVTINRSGDGIEATNFGFSGLVEANATDPALDPSDAPGPFHPMPPFLRRRRLLS